MPYRFGILGAAAAFLFIAGPANADVFKSYTCDASLNCSSGVAVSGGSFDLNSNPGPISASGLEYLVTPADTLTLGGLTNVSATYDMTTGSFVGGSPRFTLFDDSLHSAYIYWGAPLGGGSFSNPFPNGTFGSTGNYADLLSPDLRVYSNGFGGDNNPNTGVTFADFLAAAGAATPISYVTLDLDAGTYAGPRSCWLAASQ